MDGLNPILAGVLASALAGVATGVGAIPVFFQRQPGRRTQSALLGFAAGIMLAASFVSLVLPAQADAIVRLGDPLLGGLATGAAMLAGMGLIAGLERMVPHRHFEASGHGPTSHNLRGIWLFILAITIHNFPEGLAVGVGYGGGQADTVGLELAIGIGIQNLPEGLVVAVALVGEGYNRWRAFGVAWLSGAVEPVGGLLGAVAVGLVEPALPGALAFAGGAMLFVISHEIIPETHRHGHENTATAGLCIGLVAMLILGTVIG